MLLVECRQEYNKICPTKYNSRLMAKIKLTLYLLHNLTQISGRNTAESVFDRFCSVSVANLLLDFVNLYQFLPAKHELNTNTDDIESAVFFKSICLVAYCKQFSWVYTDHRFYSKNIHNNTLSVDNVYWFYPRAADKVLIISWNKISPRWKKYNFKDFSLR